ncbi:hypothetical protein ACN2C6_15975 [Caulobacter sp. ErkDOM-YI]|uniref:hypothetical protein n=1 Tax=unclassified Caulobacter TaxID=2648921 RepID=UPI003AF49069
MTLSRLSLCLAAAGALLAGAAMAGGPDQGLRGGPPVSRPGLPLDPELLPPNTGPGDCVTRRVTGPRGAYRWDRVECDTERGRTDFDPWGYGHRPLEVETLPAHHAERYSDGYDPRADGRQEDRYGPGPSRFRAYRVAGRDADGFLVWPGKRP